MLIGFLKNLVLKNYTQNNGEVDWNHLTVYQIKSIKSMKFVKILIMSIFTIIFLYHCILLKLLKH